MKKLTFLFATALCLATVALSAQTYVGDIELGDRTGFLPGIFTTNGHPYVLQFTYSGENTADISIYQSDFVPASKSRH